jgi:hypothetical protein
MQKTITHPITGKTFKMGRKPSAPQRHLKLGNYLIPGPSLPIPPRVVHYSYAAEIGMANILANDQLGCCTSSAAGHIIDTWRGNAQSIKPMVTEDQAIQFYSASTGYVPGNAATDQGGDLVTVMQTWKNKGYFADGSSKLVGWASVDVNNYDEVKAAIWLFENLYVGVSLPDAWINPMPEKNGVIWDVAGEPNPNSGHCMAWNGFNDEGVFDLTWGMVVIITPAAVKKYFSTSAGGEVFVLLSEEVINRATNKVPNGVEYNQLLTDLNNFTT